MTLQVQVRPVTCWAHLISHTDSQPQVTRSETEPGSGKPGSAPTMPACRSTGLAILVARTAAENSRRCGALLAILTGVRHRAGLWQPACQWAATCACLLEGSAYVPGWCPASLP